MGLCTWNPNSKEDNCTCHYCKDRRKSKKVGPFTSWAEFALLAGFVKKSNSGSNTDPTISSTVYKSIGCALWMMASCCLLATVYYILSGKPILCHSLGMNYDELFVAQSYCLMKSLYTLSPNITFSGEVLAHPGVGPSAINTEYHDESEMVRHVYYQWVPYFMLAQCIVFWSLRSYFMTHSNCVVFKAIVGNLEKVELPGLQLTREELTGVGTGDRSEPSNVTSIAEGYLKECRKRAAIFILSMGNHGGFLRTYVGFEVIGTAVALGNLFMTNTFFGNNFFGYGVEVFRYLWKKDIDASDHHSILNQVFPKIAKCTWRTFGPSGDIQNKGILCVLPLNVVYEKTSVVLWVVYFALAIVTSLSLLYHLCLFFIPKILDQRILSASKNQSKAKDMKCRIHTKEVLDHCTVADKFMLLNLQRYTRNFPVYIKTLADTLRRSGKTFND